MSSMDAQSGEGIDEEARLLFEHPARFARGVAALGQLPDTALPEVAFAGRSNVGKSSLINALTRQNGLARASNTPGRTQELNFFELDGRLRLVDLPGYGYAKAPIEKVRAWTELLRGYLRGRPNLARAFVLIDARRGLGAIDREMATELGKAATPFQLVITKCDQLSSEELRALRAELERDLRAMVGAVIETHATSAAKTIGLDPLREEIAAFALASPPTDEDR